MGFPFRRKELVETANELHSELKVLDADTLFNIVDAITDLVQVPPPSLPDVMAEIFKDGGSPYSSLESAVKEIASDSKFVEQRAIEEFKRSTLPYVLRIEHFCAMRARFDKQFSYRGSEIESYNPKIVDYHPIVVFSIDVQTQKESFEFQADQEGLDKLISEMIAAQRQLKLLVDAWTAAAKERTHGK
jgi:hypothetical protein